MRCQWRHKIKESAGNIFTRTILQGYFWRQLTFGGGVELGSILGISRSGSEYLRIIAADKPQAAGTTDKYKKNIIPGKVSLETLPIRKDRWTRPESRDGSFYKNDRPVFIAGVNMSSQHPFHVLVKKSKKLKKAVGNDPIYNRMLDTAMCKDLGIDSVQLNPVAEWLRFNNPFIANPRLLAGVKKLVCWSKWAPKGKRSLGLYNFLRILYEKNTEQIKLLGGTPLLPDFCPNFDKTEDVLDRLKDANLPQSILEQINGWITAADTPWCHADPLGSELDNSYFQNGAYWMLANGANPWVYELWNELHNFNCTCSYNQQRFIIWLKKRYGSLEAVNRRWNSNFKSFSAIISAVNYRSYRGLWADWMKFMGDQWQETILNSKAALRQVDARENTYVSWEISNSSVFYPTQGADCRKGAMAVDCFGYEGGVPFGIFPREQSQKANMMTQIVFGYGPHAHKFFSDMCRAVSPDKPIINFEAYVGRTVAGLNGFQAVRRNDFITSLWSEAIHGVSASVYYVWWMHPKIDPENPSGGPSMERSLLNPRTCPRDSLNGIQDFKLEMDRLAELILPRPRIRGIVALLFSPPTIWQAPPVQSWTGQKFNVKEKILASYEALHLSQYPLDVVYEEQLRERAGDYMAIVVPGTEYAYRKTLPRLTRYVKNGGILIISGGGLLYDEYGKTVDCSELLGLKRKPLPEKVNDSFMLSFNRGKETAKVSFDCLRSVSLTSARPLIRARKSGRLCVSVNRIGKGRVFYVAAESLRGSDLLPLYRSLLKFAKVEKPFTVRTLDGAFVDNLEVQLIDRGDKKIYYMVNWDYPGSKIVKLFPHALPEGKYYVTDLITGAEFTHENQRLWSGADLTGGIPVLLPSQERTLVMVSSEPWKYHQGSIAPEQLQKQLTALRAKEKLEYVQNIQKIKEAKKKNRKAEFERQQRLIFKDVNQKRCFPVNLYEHVNMGFADKVEGDGKGGWLDQGNKDLCNLPLGKQTFSGVPFRVIDPKENDGRSCIMLYSSTRKYFPKKFSGIKVGRKATRLYFLHGSGWTVSDKVFKYIVHYSDGSTVNIPITGGKQISDWYKPVEVSDAKIGWEGRNSIFKHIGLYVYRWRNPHPKKIITKLDIVSTETPTAAGIIALTGEE